MRKPLIYIIILSLLVVGCAEERHTHNPQLIVLDSLQRVSPDSAFSMLDKLNTVFLPEDSVYNNLIYNFWKNIYAEICGLEYLELQLLALGHL